MFRKRIMQRSGESANSTSSAKLDMAYRLPLIVVLLALFGMSGLAISDITTRYSAEGARSEIGNVIRVTGSVEFVSESNHFTDRSNEKPVETERHGFGLQRVSMPRPAGVPSYHRFGVIHGVGIVQEDDLLRGVASGGQTLFQNITVEWHGGQLYISGLRAVQLNPMRSRFDPRFAPQVRLQKRRFQHEQSKRDILHSFFWQEVKITLPYSVAVGGLDVRSLERELERLGIKDKPRPSLQKPIPTPMPAPLPMPQSKLQLRS